MRLPITPNMRIRDILAHYPASAGVLNTYGIRCEGCHAARYETLAHGARLHGLDLTTLLTDLNRAATERPLDRPRLPLTGN